MGQKEIKKEIRNCFELVKTQIIEVCGIQLNNT